MHLTFCNISSNGSSGLSYLPNSIWVPTESLCPNPNTRLHPLCSLSEPPESTVSPIEAHSILAGWLCSPSQFQPTVCVCDTAPMRPPLNYRQPITVRTVRNKFRSDCLFKCQCARASSGMPECGLL